MNKKYIEHEIKGTDEEILEALEKTLPRFLRFEQIDKFYMLLSRTIKEMRK